jgi:hypothetical protein
MCCSPVRHNFVIFQIIFHPVIAVSTPNTLSTCCLSTHDLPCLRLLTLRSSLPFALLKMFTRPIIVRIDRTTSEIGHGITFPRAYDYSFTNNSIISPSKSDNPLCNVNPLTPNSHYSGRTAPLTSRSCILNIYSTNISTEYRGASVHERPCTRTFRFTKKFS